MGKVLKFSEKVMFNKEFKENLELCGWSEDEINTALAFVDENPSNDDPSPTPPPKQAPVAQIIQFPLKVHKTYRQAA